jgi:hypothetical protein
MEYLQECFFAFNLIIGQNRDFLAVDVETQWFKWHMYHCWVGLILTLLLSRFFKWWKSQLTLLNQKYQMDEQVAENERLKEEWRN